jgi:hypothetical protein
MTPYSATYGLFHEFVPWSNLKNSTRSFSTRLPLHGAAERRSGGAAERPDHGHFATRSEKSSLVVEN